MKPRNEVFEVGERYLGLVDNKIYSVSEIQLPGQYETAYGGTYHLEAPMIIFRDEKTGENHRCRLSLAQYLQLAKL